MAEVLEHIDQFFDMVYIDEAAFNTGARCHSNCPNL